jgi:hypothetical protein
MLLLTAISLIVTIALQGWILGLLLLRQLRKRFPWFFVYILYALAECILRLVVSHNHDAYFKVYWSTEIGDVILTILALRESFLAIFLPETKLRWFRALFWGCIALALAYVGWEVWASPPRQANTLITAILDLEFALDTIISIVGLLYAGAIALFGILEHQRETAVILGFTANASIAMFSWITRSAFGTRFRILSEWIPAIAYIVAEVIWTRGLLRKEHTLPEPNVTLEQMSVVIDRYIGLVTRYLGRER